jgi:hypothetical protein
MRGHALHCGMEASATKLVRFSALVEKAGKPTVYLPLGDPAKDRKFMQAVKEERVLTIKQEPTSKQKDFGVVGFLKERFVTYLIFPKPLEKFLDARVVGIKYDVVEEAGVSTGCSITAKPKKAAKPPKPKPQPQHFVVRMRVTATANEEIRVEALNQREAKLLAAKEAEDLDCSTATKRTEMLDVKKAAVRAAHLRSKFGSVVLHSSMTPILACGFDLVDALVMLSPVFSSGAAFAGGAVCSFMGNKKVGGWTMSISALVGCCSIVLLSLQN